MPKYSELEPAPDGTGLKTSNAGEYRIFRYGDPEAKQRQHLVVVITAEVKRKKVIGIEVYVEGKGHSESHVEAAHVRAAAQGGHRVRKFYGDGAYDTHDIFATLQSTGTEPVIKIRKGASGSYRPSPRPSNQYRRRAVRAYRGLGYEAWAAQNQYGMRWPGTEGIFSAVKRKFGEHGVSRSPRGLVAEGYPRSGPTTSYANAGRIEPGHLELARGRAPRTQGRAGTSPLHLFIRQSREFRR